MDNIDLIDETTTDTEISFGTEIAHALIISAVSTAGALIGFAIAGVAADQLGKFVAKRNAKKNPKQD